MRNWITALFAAVALVATAPALADYPEDCLGPQEASSAECGDISDPGCCDAAGRVVYCLEGALYCIDCAVENPTCGWSPDDSWYDCGTAGGADESGTNPYDCVGCDPPCGAGEKCEDGQCVQCVADCAGKVCGGDGCGGQCGTCPEGSQCGGGLCHDGPGCEELEEATCGGCPCEACVCELDSYCCETQWDGLCVDLCISDCGGCPGECVPSCEGKECGDDGCGGICGECPEGEACVNVMCVECQADCTGKLCGDDGCGGSCGECGEGEGCVEGLCECLPDCAGKECGDDGCGGTCGECAGGECVDGQCACTPVCAGVECGDDGCGGSCGICPAGECVDGACACLPACEGKTCGDDGCGGSCGECLEGQECVAGVCSCTPMCDGKVCGDDGCGGNCGECVQGMACNDLGQCLAETGPVGGEDVVEDTGGTGGGSSTDIGESTSCNVSTGGQGPAALLLVLLAIFALAAIRRRSALS